ncbi:transposase InsI for insertion sequence element IS30A [Neptunitalea chrysea]|uniref:Transposase InsI for insertion sequence element IS30A n=1 Tax=Neptunitalea chrysea TaxID=1647581 RepID=A0A9W6EVL7_9FLAO|nr:IS30 family transposase [Neptunitalea chrysea]GLB52657.1 transposase InsI for insertion sequence element IS30A [Neptunitalea chrysea]
MNTNKHKRLSLKERVIIQTLLEENKSKSFIAKKLNRSRSTITREVNKWVSDPSDKYDASLTDWLAKDDYLNKRNLDKIETYSLLRFYVYKRLLKNWSPEQISGRIKIDFPNDSVMTISHEAIYMHIYSHPQARLNKKLIKLLPYQKSRRRKPKPRRKKGSKIKDQINISQRPKHIENRKEIGHWEGDLVIGKAQKSAIGTIVERKSRYTLIIPVKDRTSKSVTRAFAKELNRLDKQLLKTMTYDNGTEMADHKWLAENTGIDIYFANPYASWERGTNENTNGLIRRFLPKKTDFKNINNNQLKIIQYKLNNGPRKVLGYKTPLEVIAQNSV